MKDWRIKYGLGFLAVALTFNIAHFLLFNDSSYILKFIVAQLGFLPVSVFLVTIVLNQLMAQREKQALLKKMNMVVGTFFSEVGTSLLSLIDPATADESLRHDLLPSNNWSEQDYQRAIATTRTGKFPSQAPAAGFAELRTYLLTKREFLLLLLGNPNLLEHESFTELLWAVFHLAEELSSRDDLDNPGPKDAEHLNGDVGRVTGLLLIEWLSYMQHLQEDYPYLFSLAVRTNPFDRNAKAALE
jgi:hypothetical protein